MRLRRDNCIPSAFERRLCRNQRTKSVHHRLRSGYRGLQAVGIGGGWGNPPLPRVGVTGSVSVRSRFRGAREVEREWDACLVETELSGRRGPRRQTRPPRAPGRCRPRARGVPPAGETRVTSCPPGTGRGGVARTPPWDLAYLGPYRLGGGGGGGRAWGGWREAPIWPCLRRTLREATRLTECIQGSIGYRCQIIGAWKVTRVFR